MASSLYRNTPPSGRPPQAPPAPPGHYVHPYASSHYPVPPSAAGNLYNPSSVPPPPLPPHHAGYAGAPPPLPPSIGMPSSSYPNSHYSSQHSASIHAAGNYLPSSHPPPLPQASSHSHQVQGLDRQAPQQAWPQRSSSGQGTASAASQGGHGSSLSQGVLPTRWPQQISGLDPAAQSDSVPGWKEETKDERRERKKREYYEKKKLEEKQQQREKAARDRGQQPRPVASGGKQTSLNNGSRDAWVEKKAASTAEKIENRLKRPSTFLCKIKFRNELPDIVSQPKLLRINNDKDQYTKYTLTTLEKTYKHKLLVEPDLGIPLDLLDISGYKPPAVTLPLDPADAELLLDDEVLQKKEPESLRKKERPTDKGVAWLVKTQYISPLSLDPAKQSMTEKQAKELREQREGRHLAVDTVNDRDQQIQAIEESFRVAKLWPVHQTKPELEPVEILHLLPDFDRIGDQFVHMIFDTEPTADSEALLNFDQDARYEIEGRAIVKSYSIPGTDETRPERFVGYMVPKPEELERDVYDDDEEIQYTWVREYHWDMRQDDSQTYVFCFGEDAVHYLPLSTKLVLQKKKAKEGKSKHDVDRDVDRDFPIPSSITVLRRDATNDEDEQRDLLRQSFLEGSASTAQGGRLKRQRSPEIISTSSKRKGPREELSDEEDELSV